MYFFIYKALQQQELQMLNSYLSQKDKLIQEFAGYFDELEQTSTRRKEIFNNLREMVRSVKHSPQNGLENYSVKFNTAHRDSMDALMQKFLKVSNTEASVAVMLTEGLSNKDIASLTLTTIRNIEKVQSYTLLLYLLLNLFYRNLFCYGFATRFNT